MADDLKPVHPDAKSGFDLISAPAELSAAMEDFARTYPGVTWQTADDEAVRQYTALARQAAQHLSMMHYEVAAMIYKEHAPLFCAMGDSAILCVTACLHFSSAFGDQAKREVMDNLNAWSVQFPAFWDKSWLTARWKQLYGEAEAKALYDLWYKLHDLYQFYLLRAEWG